MRSGILFCPKYLKGDKEDISAAEYVYLPELAEEIISDTLAFECDEFTASE